MASAVRRVLTSSVSLASRALAPTLARSTRASAVASAGVAAASTPPRRAASAAAAAPAFAQLAEDSESLDALLSGPRATAAKGRVILYFTASWCGPCKAIAPAFASAAADAKGDVLFVKVDVDENPDSAYANEVSAVPTFVALRNKAVVKRWSGANAPALAAAVKDLLAQ